LPVPGRLGIFLLLLTNQSSSRSAKTQAAFLGKPFERDPAVVVRRYGLLAMGNGHAPGTAIGLGAAGVGTIAAGFGATRPREAGLAVFFFAAFP